MDSVSQWSIERVGQWIETLPEAIAIGDRVVMKQKFIDHKINGENLMMFTASFGFGMGILGGYSLSIEKAITKLKQGIFHIHNLMFIRNQNGKQDRGTSTKKEKEPFKKCWRFVFHY